MEQKIALEERKILIAQRKLESMRLLEELFNRVKMAVAQEEMEKRQKELSEEREKRILEEANMESAKKVKIEQEEAELNEKIRLNLEKQKQLLREAAEREEYGDVELRKNPTTMDSEDGNSNPGGCSTSSAQLAVPRSIILAQNLSPFQSSAASNTTPRAQLYDDDNNSSNPASFSNKQDANSNLEANTSHNSSEQSVEDTGSNLKSPNIDD